MAKQPKRFERISTENSWAGNNSIYVDTHTGVQYLWHAEGYAGGLTVLLDCDGKPLLAEGYLQ